MKQIDGCPDVRQTEGFVRSILTMMRAGLDAPDHTTLSRRGQLLDVAVHSIPATGALHLIIAAQGFRGGRRGVGGRETRWAWHARLEEDQSVTKPG